MGSDDESEGSRDRERRARSGSKDDKMDADEGKDDGEDRERIQKVIEVDKDDAAFVLGRGGSTKRKIARVAGAEIVITKEMVLGGDVVARFPASVRCVIEAGTGYNNHDRGALAARGIVLRTCPAYSIEAVATLVMTQTKRPWKRPWKGHSWRQQRWQGQRWWGQRRQEQRLRSRLRWRLRWGRRVASIGACHARTA